MSTAWVAVILAGIGTFAMRGSFLLAAHRMTEVPPFAQRLLRQIPPAAVASPVLPPHIRPEGQLDLFSPEAAAGLVAGIVAWRTRNSILTLVVGMAVLVALQAI